MRIRNAVLALAVAVASCAINPDPRASTYESAIRTAYGGWIEVTPANDAVVQGELLAVQPDEVIVYDDAGRIRRIPREEIASARLWKYRREGGYVAWGFLGSLSTLSHGLWLLATLPAWVVVSTTATLADVAAQRIDTSDDDWNEIIPWARFPQGIPPGVDLATWLGTNAPPGGR
jgi:hypothetical protein